MLSRDIASPPTHHFFCTKNFTRNIVKIVELIAFESLFKQARWRQNFERMYCSPFSSFTGSTRYFNPPLTLKKKSDFGLTHNAFWLRQSHHKTKPSDWTCRCICVWNMHGWRTQSRPNMEIVSVSEDVFSVVSSCGGILYWFPEYECLLSAMSRVQ